MHKALDSGDFCGLRVGQNNHIISHLQFVDETIDFKEVTMSNI
jgi:hypothetical protein